MRTFQDRNLMVWEVYPSGGRHGSSESPHVIFHCLTELPIRSRYVDLGEDGADAERRISDASNEELLRMLETAAEIA